MSDKISIRPALPKDILEGNLSKTERFQNTTIRPILKLQHDLIIATTKNYFHAKKDAFYNLEIIQQEKYITQQIIGDKNIRIELIGMIIGMMTTEEYTFYTLHASELKRRIKTMTLERILSGIDELRIKS